jgi:hypothetical protein
MRAREFRTAVEAEFGQRGSSLVIDLVLGELGGRTAQEALDAGIDAGAVWIALCRASDVPPDRHHGAGLIAPRD